MNEAPVETPSTEPLEQGGTGGATAPHRLEVKGIRVRFGATQALDGVDFAVVPGEVHALIGQNGAGKSTLMKVLSGAVLPDEGVMFVDGEAFRPADPRDARLKGVAMIYQELSLAPHLTVVENIFLGMEPVLRGALDRKQMRKRAARALELLERDIPLDAKCGSLSISDQQVVEIARAAAVGCSVLILDEPTSSLTKPDVQHLFNLIRRLRSQNYSVIYISHFMEEIQEIADTYTVLRDGKTVARGRVPDVSADQIVSTMVGRDISNLYPRSARQPGEPLLEISNLQSEAKLRAASLTVHRGEVLGIFGLVGSGRTELFRAIFGLDRVKDGHVKVGGASGQSTPASRWKQGVGMVSEDRKNEGLALCMSISDNLILSSTRGLESYGVVSPKKKRTVAAQWIEKLQVKCQDPSQKIADLSGGNQQKIAIGRLLHHDVDVLLLDEPTRGIDVGSKTQIYKLIDELALQNKAVVLISSYLPELMGTCDRVAVMARGKLSAARPVAEIDEQLVMMEATAAE